MRQYPHLLNRNGHYYFRIAVPVHLRSKLGQRELFYSLKTKDYSLARVRVNALLDVAEDVFKHALTLANSHYLADRISNIDFMKPHERSMHKQSAIKNELHAPQHNTFINTYNSYLNECSGDRDKTINKRKGVLSLWLEIVGDMPINSINKEMARHFKATLMKLPRNMKQRYPNTPIKQIELDKIPFAKRLSTKTINDKMIWMSAFMNWAIKNGYYDAANPFSGLALKHVENAEFKRLPFTSTQLNEIFSTPIYKNPASCRALSSYKTRLYKEQGAMYWIPLIALYSGARLQEICQLYLSDIKQLGEVWVFDFNDDGIDKRIKSLSSKRKTPIHPKLIQLGLLDYINKLAEEGKHRLFYDLPLANDGTYSSTFSKRFSFFLKRFGIKTGQTSFHSFRHTFIDLLRNSEVHREVREALVGHLDRNTAHDKYGTPIGVKRLYEGIVKLEFCIML